jgi:hypothetical protein
MTSSRYLVTPSDGMTLLQGPLGAALMLGGDRTDGRLSVLEHPLAPTGTRLAHPHPPR